MKEKREKKEKKEINKISLFSCALRERKKKVNVIETRDP